MQVSADRRSLYLREEGYLFRTFFSNLEFKNKTPPEWESKEAIAGTPIWEGFTDTSHFRPEQIALLQRHGFRVVRDLWHEHHNKYWRPRHVRRFVPRNERAPLSGDFNRRWRSFLNTLDPRIETVMKSDDYSPEQGEMIGYYDHQTLKFGKILSARYGIIQNAIISPCGHLRLTPTCTRLFHNQGGMPLLFDKQDRCFGPIENKLTNNLSWKISYNHKGATKTKGFYALKPKQIYRIMMQGKHVRPTCEKRWPEELGRQISKNQFLLSYKLVGSTIGTPRDYKTHFKLLHRGLWTPNKAFLAKKEPNNHCICGLRGDHKHIFTQCRLIQPLLKGFRDLSRALGQGPIHILEPTDIVLGTFRGKGLPPALLLFLFALKSSIG